MVNKPVSLIVDVETTGLNPHRDRVIDFALILTDWREVFAVLSTYINPGFDFGHNEVNGISYSQVIDAPRFVEICPLAYQCMLFADEYIGHGIKFDLRFLENELSFCDLRLPARANVDTLQRIRCKLNEACARFHIDTSDIAWHSALGDAVATFRLARKLRLADINLVSDGPLTMGPRLS